MYFTLKINIIYKSVTFHQRTQSPEETIEIYIRTLYVLAEHYAFANKEDEIWDKFVIGLISKELLKRPQLMPDLTLERALEAARTFEQIRKQMTNRQAINIVAVKKKKRNKNSHFEEINIINNQTEKDSLVQGVIKHIL